MTQVTCISGDSEYINTELAAYLSEGWEIISMDTHVFDRQGRINKETTVYLKRISN